MVILHLHLIMFSNSGGAASRVVVIRTHIIFSISIPSLLAIFQNDCSLTTAKAVGIHGNCEILLQFE